MTLGGVYEVDNLLLERTITFGTGTKLKSVLESGSDIDKVVINKIWYNSKRQKPSN
jgi:hypothetical protein